MQFVFGNDDADAFLFMASDGVDHLLDDLWRQPFPGSSSSTATVTHRSGRDLSICCSAPLMRPPGRPRISPQVGNSVNIVLSRRQYGALGTFWLAADSRFFLDRQVREDAPLFRHIAEPAAHDCMRRLRETSLPSNRMRPERCCTRPTMERNVVDLPAAIASEQAPPPHLATSSAISNRMCAAAVMSC